MLAEAGLELLGENRAQDLVAKAEAYPGAFTWDFIGQLQSRKVRQVLPHVRYIQSVASDSALAQLGRHGTARDRGPGRGQRRRRAGQERRSRPRSCGAFLERCPVPVVGLMTMPPLAADPEASRPPFRGAPRARRASTGCAICRWAPARTTLVAVQEGATIVRLGTTLVPPRRFRSVIITAGNRLPPAKPESDHGLPRHLAPHARLLRPGRGRGLRGRRSSRTPSPRPRSRTPTASVRTSAG